MGIPNFLFRFVYRKTSLMKTTLRNILIILGILLFLALLWYFRNIVVYILVAGVFSIIGRPLVDIFCRIKIGKWTFPRVISALLTLLIIWGTIILFLLIFVPLVTKQINYFSTIDSAKIVQIVEGPINKLEDLFKTINYLSRNILVQRFPVF
jgi:predicted PurR-regulated permease PerM